jgi:hypothetical protein
MKAGTIRIGGAASQKTCRAELVVFIGALLPQPSRNRENRTRFDKKCRHRLAARAAMMLRLEDGMGCLKVTVVVAVLAAAVACGQSEAEKQAEETAKQLEKAAEEMQKAADAAQKGSAGAAQGMEAFAKAMAAAAGAAAGGDGKPVEPVAFQQLETVLPDVPGWERNKPRSERMTSPVPFSQTESTYSNGDAEIEVKIVDSAFNQLLVSPWAMFLTAGYSRETSDGHEKSVTVDGNPGFEKWNNERRDGELNLVVAKRFLVTIEGNDIADAKVLHDFAAKLDSSRLAGLK